MKKVLAVVLVLLLASSVSSQEHSVVEFIEHGQPIARGVVIENVNGSGHVLTANHVVQNRLVALRVRFANALERDAVTVHTFPDCDLAIVSVTGIPAVAVPVELATPKEKMATLINKAKTRVELRRALNQKQYYYFDHTVRLGDSGCGIFENGKLVALVSGGLIWLDEDKAQTWPTRACRLDCIMDWLKAR